MNLIKLLLPMRRKERERERLNCFYLGIEVQGKLDTEIGRYRLRETDRQRHTAKEEKRKLER